MGKSYHPKYVWGKLNKNWTGPERAHQQSIGQFMAIVEADYIEMASDFDKSLEQTSDYLQQGDRRHSQRSIQKSAAIFSALQERTQMISELADNGLTEEWVDKYSQFRERNGLPASQKNPSVAYHEGDDRSLAGIYDDQKYTSKDVYEVNKALKDTIFERLTNPSGATQQEMDDYHDVVNKKKTLKDVVKEKPRPQSNPDPDDNPTEVITPPRSAEKKQTGNQKNTSSSSQQKKDDKPSSKSRKKPGLITSIEQKTGLDKNGAFRITYRPVFKGFVFNIGRNGLQSISYRLGNSRSLSGMTFRVWSRDRGSGFSSINLPGGISYRFKDNKGKSAAQNKKKDKKKKGMLEKLLGG